jgi:hypothetical protein
MDRTTAKKIAGTITNDAILEMLNTAKTRITDWGKTSKVNKCMSVGAAWCVLAEDFDVNKEYSIWSKTNMIREFGEFLPESLRPAKSKKQPLTGYVYHKDPPFIEKEGK